MSGNCERWRHAATVDAWKTHYGAEDRSDAQHA